MNGPPAEYSLQIKSPVEGKQYIFAQLRTIIGRSRVGMPDLEITDITAAPRHCVIDWNEESGMHLLTVTGINGIHLNGEFHGESDDAHVLHNGDEILIGETVIGYRRIA